ncbi:MAG: SusD/RagB family nutrient-binding outer membrane lipoprotein [Chitinophagaceae bacterium]
MSIKNIIIGSVTAIALFAAPSCDKIDDFGDMNQNPNAATQPQPRALLTNVIANMGSNLSWDQGGASTVSGLYAQLFSETQYTEASRYATPTFNFDGYYVGPLYDLQNIITFEGSTVNQVAAARVIKAHYFKFLTDTWGNIPYTGALAGEGIIAYTPQQEIYVDLIKELKEAADQFDASSMQGDILFNGNVNKWRKYANSLRLLIGLQMSKANATMGKAEVSAALSHSAGVIETNDDNVTVNYPGGNFPNPVYNYYNITQRRDYAVSKTLVDRLSSTGDPRLAAYASNSTGFPYGLKRDDAVAFDNSVGGGWARILSASRRQANSPVVVIGAANIWLARAEAAQRGWTSGNAATAYATGIQRSLEQWGVYSPAGYASYLSNVALTPGNELQQIATQEWTSWFPTGWEAYNVWRRTGFPVLTTAPGTTVAIPRRFPYGPNEYNLNPDNAKAAAELYNVGGVPDSQYGRVWFDQ